MPKRTYGTAFDGYSNKRLKRIRTTGVTTRAIARGPTRGYYRRVGLYRRFRGGQNLRNGIAPELKFKDIAHTFGAAAIPVNGVLGGSLILITSGTAPSTLVGRKMTLKNITIRGTITLPKDSDGALSGTAITDVVRIMLVWDKQCNGAQAAVTDVISTASGVEGLRNMEKSQRFQVLKEWLVNINSAMAYDPTNNVYVNSGFQKAFKYNKKCNITIHYDDTASSVIADVQDNNIFLLAISNSGAVRVSAQSRIRFLDI